MGLVRARVEFRTVALVYVILTVSVLVACQRNPLAVSRAPEPSPAEDGSQAVDLSGSRWESPCAKLVEPGWSGSESVTWSFARDVIEIVQNTYADDDCRRAALIMRLTANYRLHPASSSQPGIHPLDLEFRGAELTPLSSEAAARLRLQKYCGSEDWYDGRNADIGSRECRDGDTDMVYPGTGQKLFSVIKLHDGYLIPGEPGDDPAATGHSPATRFSNPGDSVFTRQGHAAR